MRLTTAGIITMEGVMVESRRTAEEEEEEEGEGEGDGAAEATIVCPAVLI